MHRRWVRRSLPLFIFTFFIILYVDFQLRTSSLPKLSAAHHPSPGAHQRSIQQVPIAARGAQKPVSKSSSSNNNGGGAGGGNLHVAKERHTISEGARVTQAKLKQEDIFIAVKTTGRFHRTRLALLLETWISRTKAHVSISFTYISSSVSPPAAFI